MELDGFLYLGSVLEVQKPEGTQFLPLPKGTCPDSSRLSLRLQILIVVFFPLPGFRNKWEHRVTGNHFTPRAASSWGACPWQCPPNNALAELFPNTKACKSKAGRGEEQSLAPQLHLGPWGTELSLFLPCCLGIPLLARGMGSSTALPPLSCLSRGTSALLAAWPLQTRPVSSDHRPASRGWSYSDVLALARTGLLLYTSVVTVVPYLIAVFSNMLLFLQVLFIFCASSSPLHPSPGEGRG